MTILDKIAGVKTAPAVVSHDIYNLDRKDLGTEYMGEYIGACIRASWYKQRDYRQTNPSADRLVVARHIHETIKALYLKRFSRVVEKAYPIEKDSRFIPDFVYKEKREIVGVIIFTGSGYGFRSEVFGSKSKEGSIKTDHLVQCWSLLTAYSLPLARVEALYVDRDRGDEVCYSVDDSPLTEEMIRQFLTQTTGDARPPCSYEKEWTNAEEVAKLYAERQISKKRYEDWKDSGVGGDWHCEYCPFLKQCEDDGET